MKGIVMYNMGKKQEGLDLVKKGTSLNPQSHICWHVSALVARAERNLERALACYTQAVKIDKVSSFMQEQTLRDSRQHAGSNRSSP